MYFTEIVLNKIKFYDKVGRRIISVNPCFFLLGRFSIPSNFQNSGDLYIKREILLFPLMGVKHGLFFCKITSICEENI